MSIPIVAPRLGVKVTEVTVGERAVAVIVRSQKGGGFNQGRYNPEKNEYYESLGPRQTPVEMLAKNKA